MNFRADINGLRAIAVIAVVLFHFNPNLMPGGFAGVDVFFVISGFLMTGIIFRGFENNSFNLFKFYVARANRIIPALAVVCLVLLVFGWFYLVPSDYRLLGKHIRSSIGFFSNVSYFRESGYFDVTSLEKWLLHTWSLSVEWQFYIIYPAVLICFKKCISIKNIKRLLILGTIVGFFGCVYVTIRWPNPAYYLLPTRAWEMMLGGLAYIYPIYLKNSQRKGLESLGVASIICSYLFLSSGTPWPGYLAIFPVFGAYLILISNRQNSLITNNPVFQTLGKWSYSIYLWHWPVVVFGYYFEVTSWIYTGLPISIVLGWLSFSYVEKIKFKSFNQWQNILCIKPLYAAIVLGILGSYIFNLNGFNVPYRTSANTDIAKIIDKYNGYNMDPSGLWAKCNPNTYVLKNEAPHIDKKCLSETKGGILIWGDSHMGALSTGLRKNINNMPFSMLTSSGCGPSFKIRRNGYNKFDVSCDYINNIAHESILKVKPEIVILGQRRGHIKNDWLNTIQTLKDLNVKKIIILSPFPQWSPSLPNVYAKRHIGEIFISDESFDKKVINNTKFMRDLAKKNSNFYFVDMLASLCKKENGRLFCRAKIGSELMAFDYGHLTLEGSDFIVKNYVMPFIHPKMIR